MPLDGTKCPQGQVVNVCLTYRLSEVWITSWGVTVQETAGLTAGIHPATEGYSFFWKNLCRRGGIDLLDTLLLRDYVSVHVENEFGGGLSGGSWQESIKYLQ